MTKPSRKTSRKSAPKPAFLWVTSLFGTLGYGSLLLQWSWWALLFLPGILENQYVKDFLLPEPNAAKQEVVRADPSFSLAYTVIGMVVLVVILAITAYVLAKIPSQIAKGGNKVITSATSATLPVLSHNKKVSPKQRKKLTLRLSKLFKLLLIVMPLALLSTLAFMPTTLPNEIIWLVGGLLAAGSVVWFGLQYLAAKLLGIDELKLI